MARAIINVINFELLPTDWLFEKVGLDFSQNDQVVEELEENN